MQVTVDEDELRWARGLLEGYTGRAHRVTVAQEAPGEAGAPEAMQDGPVDGDGWVPWKLVPNPLDARDVADLEQEFAVSLPPAFRAFLLAPCHLHDQVHAPKHEGRLVMWCATPSDDPLRPLRSELEAWRALTTAGLVPFAEWGDGWGPMCFDAMRRGPRGDCPVVWLEHELVDGLRGDAAGNRASFGELYAELYAELYPSCRALLEDVFGAPP